MPNIQTASGIKPAQNPQPVIKVEQQVTSVSIEQNIQIKADQVNIIQVQSGNVPGSLSLDAMQARINDLERQLASHQNAQIKPEGGIKPPQGPSQPYAVQPSTQEKQQAYEQIRRAENDDAQARESFQLVLAARLPHESLNDVTNSFLSLMRAEGGSSATTAAQKVFRTVSDATRSGIPRTEATNSYLDLRRSENDTDQTIQSFNQLVRNRRPQEYLSQMASDFNTLLRAEGGSSATDAAHKSFNVIHASLRPGESRTEAQNAYLDLRRSENDTDQAIQNYQIVNQSLRSNERRGDAANTFNTLLRSHGGSSSTNQAQQSYQLVADRMKQNESRADVANTLMNINRAENDPDQTRQNFLLIDSLLRPNESRAQETNSFLAILRQEGGSSATDKAQASYRAIKSW